MRIGLHHSVFGMVDWRSVFRRAAKIGADGVTIGYYSRSEHDSIAPDAPKPHGASAWPSWYARHGVSVASLYLRCLSERPTLTGSAADIRKAQSLISEALSAAAAMDAHCVVVPFYGPNRIALWDEIRRAGHALGELAGEAERAGVMIAAETTLGFNGTTYLLRQAGDNQYVRACVNTALAVMGRHDPAALIRRLGTEPIAQIHFRDVCGVQSLTPTFEVHLGTGEVDFHAAGRAIRDIGYDGWLIVDGPADYDTGNILRANLAFAHSVVVRTGSRSPAECRVTGDQEIAGDFQTTERMTYNEFMDRVKKIVAPSPCERDSVLAAIENETEIQVLTQAWDVAEGDWRRMALRKRIRVLRETRADTEESEQSHTAPLAMGLRGPPELCPA